MKTLFALLGCWICCGASAADWTLADLVHQGFTVRLETAKSQLVFTEGEELSLTYTGVQDAYIHVFDVNTEGVHMLFPNESEADNLVQAGTVQPIPGAAAKFALVAAPPFGKDTIVVLATREPLNLRTEGDAAKFNEFLKVLEDNHAIAPDTQASLLKGFLVEARPKAPRDWACTYLEVETRPKESTEPRPQEAAETAPTGRGWYVGLTSLADAHLEALGLVQVPGSDWSEQVLRRAPECTKPGDRIVVCVPADASPAVLEVAFAALADRKWLLVKSDPVADSIATPPTVPVVVGNTDDPKIREWLEQ